MDLIIASNNTNKIREIKEILGEKFDLYSLKDKNIDIDIEETGATFAENALIKAKAIAELTGSPALADDSGLEVFALNGAPGVYSARYGGEHGDDNANNRRLLDEMDNIPDRRAKFTSVIVVYYPDCRYITAEGSVEGIIISEPRGNNGFGYDPIFYCNELGKSFGEASEEEKNSLSHRFRALNNLLTKL